ncbi:hypothetical protein Tco_1193376 [Tanacetum coccineum]
MLGTTPNLFYDPNMKDEVGYKNLEHLKKSINAQLKLYNDKNLKYHKLKDKSFVYDNKADIRRIFSSEVVPLSKTLNKCSKEIQQEITTEEVDEFIENVNKKTYTYGDVRFKNQDLLMTIFELEAKLKSAEKGKNVNTKFDKSATLRKLICVTPMNKNKDLKAKMVSKVEVTKDKSKPVTSCSKLTNEHEKKKNEN